MTIALPPLPAPELLADLCRETATAEGVEPQLVEKDFYLTRLIWAFAQELGDQMLLKGGTLLSKVDLGFFRMSEDADFVLPGEPSQFRQANFSRMDRVRAAMKVASPIVGTTPEFPAARGGRQVPLAAGQRLRPRHRLRTGPRAEPRRLRTASL
jgi:Nucleotidyl transferase AbiEii toxin, Type IV TA system